MLGMRTRLPVDLYERTIGDLKIGESAYTTHWQMDIDRDGYGYLNPEGTAKSTPGGTVCMLVTRLASGFEVVIDRSYGHKYRDVDIPFGALEVKTIRVR